jgi:hypothetical protein
MADTDTRDPLVVLRKLFVELVRRRPMIERTEAYYDGAHNLAFAGEKFLEAFGGLFNAFADNWCGVVADAVEERMTVQGFRVNEKVEADKAAKKLWEQNELDLQSSMGHLDGLIAGAFYVTVWPGEETDGDTPRPEITVESAASTIVECHPKIRSRRTAGLRTWLADDGYEHAELFFLDRVYLFRSKARRHGGTIGDPARQHWVGEDQLDVARDLDTSSSMGNPYGVIPVVEFLNMPRLTRSRRAGWAAHSELASIMPLQDAVNKLCADMLVASEFAADPQRHLTGYEPDDELDAEGKPTGRTIPPTFKSGAGRLWWLESENAKFGQFEAADLSNYVGAIEMAVQHIASISRTPPHYLNSSADRLSGESIKSAETGLVAKVGRKCRGWGSGWEEVMRIAGKIGGIAELAGATGMETIWKDPETRTESEHVDAVSKKKDLDVPAPQLWEELGYTPEQMARFPAMRAQMQLEGMAANAAERARLATTEADRLASASLEATGALPTIED